MNENGNRKTKNIWSTKRADRSMTRVERHPHRLMFRTDSVIRKNKEKQQEHGHRFMTARKKKKNQSKEYERKQEIIFKRLK